ncbi:glucose 1-dehydrogenase [Aestuariirhabdus litorea]|uniref:SDR family oxidoreductase n=1 Tax=Aestuariirhabdus litorea TaxID=2528527 RepID=A0A3P3VKF5_9GAMM|nr:glucose 1-dehydrogenase [Aestuariirhabdus litorea]RRJ83215.1 SDR family oxidoreductase [Aestuariirhabdus litorea]RWW93372.1 glucose 1-dehydrogenase [Endozoicomonadaceae bacterium GTF-13]
MSQRLDNRVAWVTGGGSGIGQALCLRFAEEGARVVVTDIDLLAAEAVAAQIDALGGQAIACQQDVTSEARWAELAAELEERLGPIEVLVNNAGIAIPGSVESATLEQWQQTQRVNLESVFLGTRTAIGAMKERGGSIINISSIEGIIGEPSVAAYNASKGGVRIFSKSAALHCAAQGYPVRVNSVHPGYVETPMISKAVGQMEDTEAQALLARVMASIPMGRMAQGREIANGCLFLASDESSYMTGSELVIDGGYTAR